MEDHALTPPAWLERAVLALIPPLARETVAGDLCETYENPRQYAREALATIPFVIASQMRRNLNAPALLVQLALAAALLGPVAALLLAPVLLLRDAWQPVARPSAHDAIRSTMIIALLAMIAVQALAMNVNLMLSTGLSRANWISLYFFGFLVAPLLCILRTGLIVDSDRRGAPKGDMAVTYDAFRLRARRHNIIEGAMLVLAAGVAARWLDGKAALLFTALYLVTAIYLLWRGAPTPLPGDGDARTVAARYAIALDARRQLRRFLWWLWCAPALLALQQHAGHNPIAVAMAGAATVLCCFLLSAINREHGGRIREEMRALERLA
jgi:hypothetical protein